MAAMTPAARVAALEAKLSAQQRECKLPEDYYDGKHRLAFATDRYRQTFGSLFSALAVNWCRPAVDSLVERLRIDGFDWDDEDGNKEAREIWEDNNLVVGSRLIHSEAVKCGKAYALVEPTGSGQSPNIYPEHPSQMVVGHPAGNWRVREAALKKWLDDDGYLYATLYLPDKIYKLRSQQRAQATAGRTVNWQEREAAINNPLGVVPVIPFYNNPTMLHLGVSELVDAMPINDAINKLIADMLIDSETLAFVQRVLIGAELPRDAEGNLLPGAEIRAIRSKVWDLPAGTEVQELRGADLNGYVEPIGMLIRIFSVITGLPPHYLVGEVVNAAGDALKIAETRLVKKAEGRHDDFGDPWGDATRVAFLAKGDTKRAAHQRGKPVWGDAEQKSDAERTDAAIKQRALAVPLEVTWRLLGFSPDQIQQMKVLAGLPERPGPGSTANGGPPTSTPPAGGGAPEPAPVAG